MVGNRNWTSKELALVRAWYGERTYPELAAMLPGRTMHALHKMVGRMGIVDKTVTARLNGAAHRRYQCDERFFANPLSLNACYWAGFIAADGYVHETKRIMTLGVHPKDVDHLRLFAQRVAFDGPIHTTRVGQRLVTIYSDSMVADLLNNFNITQAKSLTLKPPVHLAGEQAMAFAKGYIDGDGSIGYRGARRQFTIEVAGTCAMMRWLLYVCRTEVDHSNARAHAWGRPSPCGNICKAIVRDTRAERIRYRFCELPVDGLARKWAVCNPVRE